MTGIWSRPNSALNQDFWARCMSPVRDGECAYVRSISRGAAAWRATAATLGWLCWIAAVGVALLLVADVLSGCLRVATITGCGALVWHGVSVPTQRCRHCRCHCYCTA